jgi:hypothetical protein
LERWLHQHIFKVGWLVTRSFQTTTILYYTFFLPGVLLRELTTWLVAGMLNVHATSSIQWPEAQEIAELDLSFVELTRNIPPFRMTILAIAPVITGLISVWVIAQNILGFDTFFAVLQPGSTVDAGEAIRQLTTAPDFWLWTYLLFVIGNTMIPRVNGFKAIRRVLIVVVVALVALAALGLGEPLVLRLLVGPVAEVLNVLAAIFVVVICIDVFFVVLLGTIEAVIERITGHSATFRRGKLIAMTRQERIEEQRKRAQRESRALARSKETKKPAGLPSIYSRPLSIPGPPGDVSVTQSDTVIIGTEEKPALAAGQRPDSRRGPDMIATTASSRSSPVPKPALVDSVPDREGDSDEKAEDEIIYEDLDVELPDDSDLSQLPDEDELPEDMLGLDGDEDEDLAELEEE